MKAVVYTQQTDHEEWTAVYTTMTSYEHESIMLFKITGKSIVCSTLCFQLTTMKTSKITDHKWDLNRRWSLHIDE